LSAGPEILGSRTLSERLGFRAAVVELGHTHPAVRRVMGGVGGTLSFLVTLDDDRIEALELEIGLGHRGFEKEVESRPWAEALPYVGRLGYGSGPIAQVGYCLALERLAGLEVAMRATRLRTLVCELARVVDHLARIAALAAAIGASAAERAVQQGERVAMKLLVAAVGGDPFGDWVLPGGVARDLSADFAAHWTQARTVLEATLERVDRLLLAHPTAALRLVDVAPLGAEACLALGITGPCLRAAGIARDGRRDAKLLAYDELEFDVPIGEQGDDYDRLAVVVEEVRQSLRLIEQSLRRLAETSEGPVSDGAALRGPVEPSDLVVPAGEVALSIESSTGELGFFLASDGGGALPRRIRCRAPSFFHAQALPAALVHARLDDLLPTAALFHLVSGECDR
jgi:NADH-quinone oxidoreductase subunit D